MTRAASEHVHPEIAGQNVVKLVARPVDRPKISGKSQVLEIGPQRPAHSGAHHQIRALIGVFHHHGIAHTYIIGIVACPTSEHIHPEIAGQNVVKLVARPVDPRGPGKGQVLESGPYCETHGAPHRIDALVCLLRHDIPSLVHHIGIVARAAEHRICPRAAGQHVGRAVAREGVSQTVPRPIDRSDPSEGQVFNIRPQCEIHGAQHQIDALVCLLRHDIPGLVHHIGIVARAAEHRIGPHAPGQHVGCAVAREAVIQTVASPVDRPRPGEQQVFNIRPQRETHVAYHQIGPLRCVFHHGVARAHHIGIIAIAAQEGIRLCPTNENVVAVSTDNSCH